jgi:hypothetical protein
MYDCSYCTQVPEQIAGNTQAASSCAREGSQLIEKWEAPLIVSCEYIGNGWKCSSEGLTADCCTRTQDYLRIGTIPGVGHLHCSMLQNQKCEIPPTVTCEYIGKGRKCPSEGMIVACCVQSQDYL